jgi:hypothetical protein
VQGCSGAVIVGRVSCNNPSQCFYGHRRKRPSQGRRHPATTPSGFIIRSQARPGLALAAGDAGTPPHQSCRGQAGGQAPPAACPQGRIFHPLRGGAGSPRAVTSPPTSHTPKTVPPGLPRPPGPTSGFPPTRQVIWGGSEHCNPVACLAGDGERLRRGSRSALRTCCGRQVEKIFWGKNLGISRV